MINFLNDYNDKGHEKIYEYLTRLPEDQMAGYCHDSYSIEVKNKIKKELGQDDAQVEFLPGGTIANIVALTHNLRSYEAIICAATGHIAIHETASIEATGHKLVTLPTPDGKLTPDLLQERLPMFGSEMDIIPKVVYISNTTETGQVYSLAEIQGLYKVCKEYNCYFYIDGARLGVAMAQGKYSLKDIAESCDYFTIGGTKNGAIYGEILVITNDELKIRIRNHMKQKGSIMAKGFILAAQFDALFDDGLYYQLAEHSLNSAMKLKAGLEKLNAEFAFPPESNQLFIKLDDQQIEKVESFALIGVDNLGGISNYVRLCTNYRTTDEEIDEFLEKMSDII